MTLGIPPSPSARPVTQDEKPVPDLNLAPIPRAPKLSLATPAGTQQITPQPATGLKLQIGSTTGAAENTRPRADSYNARVPGSASSSAYSGYSLVGAGKNGTPDPSSAISSVYSEAGVGGASMERDNSMGGMTVDFEKLSLEKGRPLDVEDLDDEGWGAACEQKKIIELGSLGEGAGGAVTQCKLEGGNTVFALKVNSLVPCLKRC